MMPLTPLGVAFTDIPLSNVGSSQYQLPRDFFIRQGLVIRTAGGGGGTQLTEGVDYELPSAGEDLELSKIVTDAYHDGTARQAMKLIVITNPTYQTGTLYHSGLFVADSLDPSDINTMGYLELSADHTILDWENYRTYGMKTGVADKTITLPTLADNIGKIKTAEKIDSEVGEVVLDGEGAEVFLFQGATYTTIRVGRQYQHVTVEATPAGWLIIDGVVQSVTLEPDIGGGWHNRQLLILNVDPADTNWHQIDLSALPDGVCMISCTYCFMTAATVNREINLAQSNGGTPTHYMRNAGTNPHFFTFPNIILGPGKALWYKASNTDISTIYLTMTAYCLGPS